MGKREELYLKPGMNEAALLEEFKTRNNYYYVIASQLVADVKRYVEGSSWVDFLGRGGSVSWQVTRAGASSVFLDYRESFVTQA